MLVMIISGLYHDCVISSVIAHNFYLSLTLIAVAFLLKSFTAHRSQFVNILTNSCIILLVTYCTGFRRSRDCLQSVVD